MQHRKPRPERRDRRLPQPCPSSPTLQPRAFGGFCPCSRPSTPGKPVPRPTRDSQASFFPSCEVEKMFLQRLCESQTKKHATVCLLQRPLPDRASGRAPRLHYILRQHLLGCHGVQWGEPTITPAGSTLVLWSALSSIPKSKTQKSWSGVF